MTKPPTTDTPPRATNAPEPPEIAAARAAGRMLNHWRWANRDQLRKEAGQLALLPWPDEEEDDDGDQ